MKRMAHGGPIKPEEICRGAVGQSSFIYSSVHSEIFPEHIGCGRKCAKHCGGHRDGRWVTLHQSQWHTAVCATQWPYFPKVIVWHLVPPFLAFISFLCNGVPSLGRRGRAATYGSVFEQRATQWNDDPGKPRGTVLSSAIWLGTVLAMSKSPENKINYMNNSPVIQWERFQPQVNTFYGQCFENLLGMQENVDVAAIRGLAGHP